MSADTMVPGAGNPQSLNRYAYAVNNPVRYTDPSGHCVIEYCLDDLSYYFAAAFGAGSGSAYAQAQRQQLNYALDQALSNASVNIGEYLQEQKLKIALPVVVSMAIIDGVSKGQQSPEDQVVYAKPGVEIAAHLAMLMGVPSIGGIPPHSGKPDPEGRDRKHNVEGLRDTLKNQLRNIQRTWGENAEPNLERWLQQNNWKPENITELQENLRFYEKYMLDNDVDHYGVSEELASEVRDLLTKLGVTQP